MSDFLKSYIHIILIGLAFIFGFLAVLFQPYFEVREFNQCTGGNATYMTAAFTELRVESCNK